MNRTGRGSFRSHDERTSAIGRAGGLAQGRRAAIVRAVRWQERFPGLQPEIGEAIYAEGYDAGYEAGRRSRSHKGVTDASRA